MDSKILDNLNLSPMRVWVRKKNLFCGCSTVIYDKAIKLVHDGVPTSQEKCSLSFVSPNLSSRFSLSVGRETRQLIPYNKPASYGFQRLQWFFDMLTYE